MGLIPDLFKAFRDLTAKEGVSRGFYQPRTRRMGARALGGQSGQMLEVGCGQGFYLEEVALAAPELSLVGIDFSVDELSSFTRPYLEKKVRSRALLVGALAEALPFRDETFDAAACINTTCNLPTLDVVRAFLKEMARVLRPGGRCIVDIRNRWNFPMALRFKLVRWHDPAFPYPLRVYSLSDLERAARGVGLRPVRYHRIGLLKSPLCPIIVIEMEKASEDALPGGGFPSR